MRKYLQLSSKYPYLCNLWLAKKRAMFPNIARVALFTFIIHLFPTSIIRTGKRYVYFFFK